MTPASEQEIAETLRSANTGINFTGGATRSSAPTQDLVAMSTRGFSGIIDYEPGALTLVVRSGTPLGEVESVLDEAGQCLIFEPPRCNAILATSGESTIGGVIATNASGPRRVQWGACRDFVLGTRFVTGAGKILASGGRVMKNVTGYDVSGLLCGSHGSLGILTEISLKVLPQSRASATLSLASLGLTDALAALSAAMASPNEVTGAAYLPGSGSDDSRTLVRLEGLGHSVQQRSAALTGTLGAHGSIEVNNDHEHTVETWTAIRDARRFADVEGNVWRINVAADRTADLIRRLQGMADMDYMIDWAGALVWIATRMNGDIRDLVGDIKCSATLIRDSGSTTVAKFHHPGDGAARILRDVKSLFDPRSVLNPHIDLTGCPP